GRVYVLALWPGPQGLDGWAPRNRVFGGSVAGAQRVLSKRTRRTGIPRTPLARLRLASQVRGRERDDRGLGLDADLRDREVDGLDARSAPQFEASTSAVDVLV